MSRLAAVHGDKDHIDVYTYIHIYKYFTDQDYIVQAIERLRLHGLLLTYVSSVCFPLQSSALPCRFDESVLKPVTSPAVADHRISETRTGIF